MMNFSTSLIRIRYAVGVMLALSAVFAVVIGTSTLQHRDATAQATQPTLSITVTDTEISEVKSGRSFDFTVTASAVETTEVIDVTVTVSGDSALNLPATRTVQVPSGPAERTVTGSITFDSTSATSGKRVVTLSLPSSHNDFVISSTANSAKVTIHDADNSAATGSPVILVREAAGTTADPDKNVKDDTPDDTSDAVFSLGTTAVSGGQVSSGDVLVADLRSIADADGLVSAKGTDKMLGAVKANGRVATTAAGVINDPADTEVGYSWIRILGKDDDTLDADGNGTISTAERDGDGVDTSVGTSAYYTVADGDIGNKIKVKVTIQDDGAQASITPDNTTVENVSSTSVGVPATLSINLTGLSTDVAENAATFNFNVQSTGAIPAGSPLKFNVSLSGAAHLDLDPYVEVTMPANTGAGSDVETSVDFSNRAGMQGKQTVTLSLPSSVSGYRISSTADSVDVTIHDDENSAATGSPSILLLQAPGTDDANVKSVTDDKGTPDDTSDDVTTYSLGTSAVSGGQVASGDRLVADLAAIMDADGLDTAKGVDKALGAVINGRVATDSTGDNLATIDDVNVTYNWVRILGVDDDDPNRPATGDDDDVSAGTSASYTVVDADIGNKLKLEVTISDDGTAKIGALTDTEVVTSASLFVPPTLSIATTTEFITEGVAIAFTVTSNTALAADQDVTVSIDTSKAAGLGLSSSKTVTIDISENTTVATGSLDTTNSVDKDGKRIVVLSLPSSLEGFVISDTASSVTITVHDTTNTAATGKPALRVREAAGTATDADANVKSVTDDNGTPDDASDDTTTYSLGSSPVPAVGTSSGMVLVADLNALGDKDGLDSATGPANGDGQLGVVSSTGRVQTEVDGDVLSSTTTPALDDVAVTYAWKKVNGVKDSTPLAAGDTADEAVSGAGDAPSYTVASTDIGTSIYVEVTFADDADDEQTRSSGPHTKDREKASSDPVEILRTLSVSSTADVAEGAETGIVITVTSDSAVTATGGLTVPVTISGPSDLGLPATVNVTIAKDATTGTATYALSDVAEAQGKREVTLSLPSTVTGYLVSSTANEFKVTVHDNENSEITGTPTILQLGAAVRTAGGNTTPTTDDVWKRQASAITNPTDVAAVGAVLVADLRSLMDADGLVNAIGTDDMLGIVDSDGMVTLDGNLSTSPLPTPDSANDNIVYAWGTVDADGDFTAFTTAVTTPTYTVASGQLGNNISVRVTIRDDAYTTAGNTAHTEEVDSSNSVKAAEAVSFGAAEYVVQEGKTVDIQVKLTNLAGAATTVNLVTTPTEGDLADGLASKSVAFTATDSSQVVVYTAPTDGPGTRSLVVSIDVDEDGVPQGTGLTKYVVGEHGSTTIRITDETDTPPTGDLQLSDTTPTVGQTLTATLKDVSDIDLIDMDRKVRVFWNTFVDKDADGVLVKSEDLSFADDGTVSSTYTVSSNDAGKEILVGMRVWDKAGGTHAFTLRTSPVAALVTDRPDGTAKISRIAPTIRGVTVSGGDTVRLSVDVYGLQNVKDAKLANDVTFNWTVSSGGGLPADKMGNSTVVYTTPSSPRVYTVTASLGSSDCYDSTADAGKEMAGCSASFEVRVRRAAPPQPPEEPAQNPPGEIPSILSDSDGNQYEVFTPEGGGAFVGDGYSISAEAGTVPNNEYIGIRVSDEGAASNAGMTHQRYTLGGNMYMISAVDASNAMISSYELRSAAEVCLPLPSELRTNISDLAIVTINSDGSLTILAASVRLSSAEAHVCGSLSALPASVAVGSAGAPAALPTATPEPEPEIPETGGAAPTSNAGLWILLLGTAIATFGTLLVIARRRASARK